MRAGPRRSPLRCRRKRRYRYGDSRVAARSSPPARRCPPSGSWCQGRSAEYGSHGLQQLASQSPCRVWNGVADGRRRMPAWRARCQPGPLGTGIGRFLGPKPPRRKIMQFLLRQKPRQYLPAQAFSHRSHIGIIQEYKMALASVVINAFVRPRLHYRDETRRFRYETDDRGSAACSALSSSSFAKSSKPA